MPLQLKDMLTPRELDIVSKVAEGLSNADAAKDLGLSTWGMKQRLVRIMDRVGCDNRVQLAVRYVREQRSRDGGMNFLG
jgi:DNA-binding NarL/FixJ family response regulator